MLDLTAQADSLKAVLAGITDDQLDDPTPCTESTVGMLLGHVGGLAIAFRDAAVKIDGPTTSTPGGVPAALDQHWRQTLPPLVDELATAWTDPAAWEGMTKAGGVQLPGGVAGTVASNEMLLHGWDLAVATGQPYEPSPANLQASYEMCLGTPADPAARQGLFGPVVAVADDASLLDRTLGLAGRDPQWARHAASGGRDRSPSGPA